jgi:hypothetical protein
MRVTLTRRALWCLIRLPMQLLSASLNNKRLYRNNRFCPYRVIERSALNPSTMFSPSVNGNQPTMASADFYCPILISRDNSSQWQANRPPKVMRVTFTLMPAVSTSAVSGQVLGFEDIGLLTHCDRLIYDFCSSGQCFAFSFLQISPHDEHPCRSANYSPCRANSGLSPPSHLTATTRVRTAPRTGATRHTWRTKKKTRIRRVINKGTLYRVKFVCT